MLLASTMTAELGTEAKSQEAWTATRGALTAGARGSSPGFGEPSRCRAEAEWDARRPRQPNSASTGAPGLL